MSPLLRLTAWLVLAPVALQAAPQINEFAASNKGGIQDEEGDRPDWIELHNPSAAPATLRGWSLTDDPGRPRKWDFPDLAIPPQGYLVVFASGKNRRDPARPLHTNFKLEAEGEYLALIGPDGRAASEFQPVFPNQYPDVSFGASSRWKALRLITTNSPVRWRVPDPQAPLPEGWQHPGFTDGDWEAGFSSLGYDTGLLDDTYADVVLADAPIHYYRLEETSASQPAADLGTRGSQPGTYTGGVRLQEPSAHASMGKAVWFNGVDGTFVNLGRFHAGNRISVEAWVRHAGDANNYYHAIVARWDGSFELDVNTSGPLQQTSPGPGNFVLKRAGDNAFVIPATASVVPREQWVHLVGVYDGSQVKVYLNGVPGNPAHLPGVLNDAGSTTDRVLIGATREGNFVWKGWIDEVAIYNYPLSPEQIQRHLEAPPRLNSPPHLEQIALTPVRPQMHERNASLLARVPFQVENPERLGALMLRLQYDDGCVVYLNGVEVFRSGAPGEPGQPLPSDASATAKRLDLEAVEWREVDLLPHVSRLARGGNVLAVHALNRSAADADFLFSAELTGFEQEGSAGISRYFRQPTPGGPNGIPAVDRGPILGRVSHAAPQAGQEMLVTAEVTRQNHPLGEVRLRYRRMFEPEQELLMRDDGMGGDATAGDGLYSARIPGAQVRAGEMLRWKVVAVDAEGSASQWPLFFHPQRSDEYLGTVVPDPLITTPLPVFHWFLSDTNAADTREGTRASLFHLGEFYDNVPVRVRGATAPFYRKKPYKFDFHEGHFFRMEASLPRMEEINLNSTYQDKTYVRPILAFEAYREAGVPAPEAFNVRVQRNGAFYSVAVLVEQVDDRFLARNSIDPEGALYKFHTYNGLSSSTLYVEKKTRLQEDHQDLQQLVAAVAPANPDRGRLLFEQVDLPKVINYLAAGAVFQDFDRTVKNYYLYRETRGSGYWRIFPWDKDLTFGLRGLESDYVSGNDDWNGSISHPFFGMAERQCCGTNLLIDAVFKTPATREMYLRRLRSLMDELLQPPETAQPELRFEQKLDAQYARLQGDAALDFNAWGTPYGVPQDLRAAMTILKSNFLLQRRAHLYVTHSLQTAGMAGIPGPQSSNPPLVFGVIEVSPASGNPDEEFIQIVNTNSVAVDLSGWTLSGGVEFTFEPGTVIPSGATLHLAASVRQFRQRTTGPSAGQGLFVVGGYRGHLSDFGEELVLRGRDGTLVASITTPRVVSPAQEHLRISEIHYHPADPAPGSPWSADDFEFIELVNTGPLCLELTGIRFTQGITFVFDARHPARLGPGEHLLLVKREAAFRQRYGPLAALVAGEYSGNLSNGGERLKLEEANGRNIHDFTYRTDWHPDTDGGGYSLVVKNPAQALSLWGESSGWEKSTVLHGTPGQGATAPAPGDSDRDGLPDAWENRHFSSLASGPFEDPDGDGASNLEEYMAGTVPTDSASRLALRVVRTAGQWFIEFDDVAAAGPGYDGKARFYLLEQRSSLQEGAWASAPGVPRIEGAGGTVRIEVPETAAARYFRLRSWLECAP